MNWAYPIARELQTYRPGLAIKWAVECIKIYLSEFRPEKLAQLDRYVRQATEEPIFLTPLQCSEMGREIWYLPDREEVQTAIARLWWSISAFQDGEEQGGARESSMAVELVLPDISDSCLLDRYLEAAVRVYEESESQNCTIGSSDPSSCH